MELNILEEKKNALKFELRGEDHSFCNLLKDELWNDKHVKVATYNIKHPLIGIPMFIVETDGKDPKKVLDDAGKRLSKTLDKFKKDFSKEVR